MSTINRRPHQLVFCLILLMLLVSLVITACARTTPTVQTRASHPTLSLRTIASPAQQHPCTTIASPWVPTGTVWNVTVSFVLGSRAGQTETSLMTFFPGGKLAATFPASPGVSVTAGWWCMSGVNAFHYQFAEPVAQGMVIVAAINAYLLSRTRFEAGGIGIGYATATGQPMGIYNVTRSDASAQERGKGDA